MSNNLIRKGLAVVASASLALAGVVGISSPANAAPSSLVLQSSFGATSAIQTSATQNGVLGYEFNLFLQAPGVAVTDEVLYLVESTDIATASVTVMSRFVPTLATAETTTTSRTIYRGSGDAGGGSDVLHHSIRTAGTGKLVIQPSYTAARLSELHQLTINLSATYGATKTVTVTPFVDEINNDAIDSSEVKGTPIVITLHKASEVTFASQLVAPTTSSQTLRANVTANKDVNIAQWRTVSSSPVRNQFYVNGTNEGGTNVLVAWSGDVARADSSSVSIPTGAVVSVQQSVAGGAYAASGTTSTISAGDVATISAIAHAGGFSAADAGTSNIRLGDGNVSVKTTVTVKSGAKKSGQKVTFKIEENAVNSIAAAAAVTAGGKSLTNSSATTSQSIEVDVLTDADGVATLPITYTGLVADNAFKITASAVGVGGGVVSSATVVKTAVASVANALVDLAKISATAVRSVVVGGNVSVQYRLVDQFGQTPTGVYQASASLTSVTSSGAVFSNVFPVTNGLVTVSFTDNSNVAAPVNGSYVLQVDINKQQTDGSYAANGASGGLSDVETTINVKSAAQAAATLTLAANDTTSVARDAIALTSVDKRVAKFSTLAPATTGGAVLNGTALGSNGALQAGVAVTLSAPGVLFQQNDVWSLGSITVHTSANGAWGGVSVHTNRTGNQTITATSGSATKTLVVEFAGTAYADGDAISISAPKSIKNGRTLTMTVALVDKFGNGVSSDISRLKVTYSGPGFEIRDPAAAELAAKTGIYTVRVLLGAGDTGVAAVTASFNADTIATGAAVDTLTASAATWVGPIANAKAATKAGRVTVEAYRAKGKTVSVFVGSTRVASFVSNKADFTKVVRGVKAGTRNVSVRLSGPGQDFTGAITVK
jgi:hypothetical protein